MPADRRQLRVELQRQRSAESGAGDEAAPELERGSAPSKGSGERGGKGGGRKGKGKGKGGGRGAGSSSKSAAEQPAEEGAEAAKVGDGKLVTLEGIPWELLPCEVGLAATLRTLAAAQTSQERDAATLAALRNHTFIEVKGRPGGTPEVDFGEGLGLCKEEHFRMDVRGFNKWLRTPEGRPFLKQAGGPSDDGIYTLSATLRRCMPRGLSRFVFAQRPSEEVLVRGFRKFTGLTVEDEDEESGATNMYEDFYYTKDAPASKFTVTTKSNGENGKFAVRSVGGRRLLCAGSKNTCIIWSDTEDVTKSHPVTDGLPGPLIAEKAQGYFRGWSESTRDAFSQRVIEGGWTLMLESNCSAHEHIFPIPSDFVEFVAILDRDGLPLPQQQAFAFFDEYKLPRVRCEEGLPMSELPARLVTERLAVDREGAVLYLETEAGAPVGLLKVKSNFYVRARRTRQTFWGALIDPLLRGDALDAPKSKGKPGLGWEAAESRLNSGMKDLKHVEGCEQHGKEWAEVAVGFVRWWRKKYEGAASEEARKALIKEAKGRFGSTYRDYCRDAGLPGGEN